ncbi:uncharacterized protein RCC_04604 [Ramularia collo-cygni]|uniref:ASX DEUBAD domain-containing protein n=1 Tax=Ramularia collo-cygni TaxID=112498 RepID=A0A2D3UZU7_9PEZI|nr:uncharacterized protein RCC_04604 [Ramularia collo-cygni]CZT18760.1 uncharacterized protein RCC_04604 [Ramularia collo-cygni]
MAASLATQKKWLTASNGKLSKVGKISAVLQKEMAWELLPPEARQRLYELLPEAPEGRPHNPDVHPFKTMYLERIKTESENWHNDLKDGKETKKWRDEAMQAGRDRSLGLWDDWKEARREETWGVRQDENVEKEDDKPETLDGGENMDATTN